jgi:ribose-phosphate pyrophosphokinase
MAEDELLIFGGSASKRLTGSICSNLGIMPGANEVIRFPDGNLFVRVQQNVRGRHVWIDAFKRASAASVTAIVPYFSYAKGDKKDEPRVSIRARVCADAIEAAGVDRVVTVDLHAPQIQGFFKVPVDDLYAMPVLCEAARKLISGDLVVVSPGVGFAKKAREYAARLRVPLAIADKQRLDHGGGLVINEIIGDVRGRAALIVDDFVVAGGTLVKVSEKLMECGAAEVFAAVTHGVFTQECMSRLDTSPIRRLLVTDTIETQPVVPSSKVEVVSLAPLLAEAIRRIHTRQSISVLFEEADHAL